jgi:hypothetical protein
MIDFVGGHGYPSLIPIYLLRQCLHLEALNLMAVEENKIAILNNHE